MNNKKIHNDYFIRKAKSRINLIKRKNKNDYFNQNIVNKSKDPLQKGGLYKEDFNYNIETSKTTETKDKEDDYISIYKAKASSINQTENLKKFNTINIMQSDSYTKNLETKNKSLQKQIKQLLEYKNLCEKKIKSLNPEETLPLTIDSLNPNSNTYRNENNNKGLSNQINNSYSYKHSIFDSKTINYGKTLEINQHENDNNFYKAKYMDLYKKYINIYNENKRNNIKIIKLQNIIDKNKSEKGNINEVNEWKEKAEIFRNDLILSQALVNSLKAEIETLKKNIKNNSESKVDINYNNLEMLSNLNKNENPDLFNENNILKKSLSDKNTLISNILEENYKLINIIKSTGININELNEVNNKEFLNNLQIMKEMKNTISQYENKFDYFNDYINNIKKEIQIIYNDIIQNLGNNNFNNNELNNINLSENFYKEINIIKNKVKDIKIDIYNLDYSIDISCMDCYMNLLKIYNEELNKMIIINNNFNLINEKENKSINDLLTLSKNFILNDNFKKALNDIFNTNKNINELYKQKLLNQNNYNNIDIDILINNQEKEVEEKKKFLLDKSTIRKTYYLTSNSRKKNKNTIKKENKMKSIDDYNNIKNKKNFYRNKLFGSNKPFDTHKKSSYSRDKIIMK